MDIQYITAKTADLRGILQLQKANLPKVLDDEEIKTQGFLTLQHSPDLLQRMNDIERHVIAKDPKQIIAYVLAMTAASEIDIPELSGLFEQFARVEYRQKRVTSYQYLIVGQVCVDKAYRGQGIFDQIYAYYKKTYQHKYDFAITAIAANNLRSLRAHQRIGFQPIHSFLEKDQKEWWIVIWDWSTIKTAP